MLEDEFGASKEHINKQRKGIEKYIKNADEGVQRLIEQFESNDWILAFVNDYCMVFTDLNEDADIIWFDGIHKKYPMHFPNYASDLLIDHMNQNGFFLKATLENGILFEMSHDDSDLVFVPLGDELKFIEENK